MVENAPISLDGRRTWTMDSLPQAGGKAVEKKKNQARSEHIVSVAR
jgi:hypothetical protein